MVGEKVISKLTVHILNPGLGRTLGILDVKEGPKIRAMPYSPLYPQFPEVYRFTWYTVCSSTLYFCEMTYK